MNYGEVKQNLISLGFAEESDYEEYEELGYTFDSINRAISIIGTQFPYVEKYEFELDDTDDGIVYIDMTDQDGFLELSEMPVRFEKNGKDVFQKFGNYQVEMEHTIVINADENKGTFRIYYNKACTPVTADTPDTFELELPEKVHHLVPLLAAYFLWLDDDAVKAAYYYNMYEAAYDRVLQNTERPRMRVRTDWGEI